MTRGSAEFWRDCLADAVAEHYRQHGEPPTVRELQRSVGLSTTSLVHYHLRALQAEGRVRRGRRGWMPT